MSRQIDADRIDVHHWLAILCGMRGMRTFDPLPADQWHGIGGMYCAHEASRGRYLAKYRLAESRSRYHTVAKEWSEHSAKLLVQILLIECRGYSRDALKLHGTIREGVKPDLKSRLRSRSWFRAATIEMCRLARSETGENRR